jgi:alpha-mannosidase
MGEKNKEHVVHLVPQFHYDVEYLKAYDDYLPVVFDNLLEAQKILSAHPEYTFLVEQVLSLEEFFEKYPELLPDFRRFAQEGRLEISGGYYVMADLNMPSGESLLRQIIYGRRWLKEHLDVTPAIFHGGDCIGHNAQLPQLVAKCGYRGYIFERAIDRMDHEDNFLWQGIDGTRIPTHWWRMGYGGCGPFSEDEARDLAHLREAIEATKRNATSNHLLLAQGGDFVKPSASVPERIKRWNALHPEDRISFSTFKDYFEAVSWSGLETCEGEFNPDRQGTYSSRIKIKQTNRELENAIFCVEALSTLAHCQAKIPYPEQALDEAWKHILINQFHDIIWGTIVDQAMVNVVERQKKAKALLSQMIEERLAALSSNDQNEGDKRIIIFNPLPNPGEMPLEIDVGSTDSFQVVNEEGTPIETQQEGRELIFVDRLPPMGCQVYYLKRSDQKTGKIAPPKGEKAFTIENKFYKMEIAPSGVISSLILNENNQEFVDQSRPWFNNICLQTDHGDLWQYYEGPLSDGGPFGSQQDKIDDPLPKGPLQSKNGRRTVGIVQHSKDGAPQVELIENGPVRYRIRVQAELAFWVMKVAFVQYITMYRNLRRIDFQTEIMPEKGKHYRIRAAFPTTIKDGTIQYEIPFGSITRPQGEFPALNWISYSNEGKGLCLLNKGLPGNNVTDGVVMLSLMRSVAMEYKGSSETAFEQGTPHSFSYAIIPYRKSEEGDLRFAWEGQRFNLPLYYRTEETESGHIERDKCISTLFEWTPRNVICSALKMSDEKIVLRVYESEGRETKCKIVSSLKIDRCFESNCLEEPIAELTVAGNSFEVNLSPFEIKTFVVALHY